MPASPCFVRRLADPAEAYCVGRGRGDILCKAQMSPSSPRADGQLAVELAKTHREDG